MNRDMDLVREIARHLEAAPPAMGRINMPTIPGFSEEEVGYHAYIMTQAGLIESASGPLEKPAHYAVPLTLTWAGHEFLNAAKDDTLWAKAKKNVIAPAGGVAFTVLLEWLKAEASARLGLPSLKP